MIWNLFCSGATYLGEVTSWELLLVLWMIASIPYTLHGTNISCLEKSDCLIFKHTLGGDMWVPTRVYYLPDAPCLVYLYTYISPRFIVNICKYSIHGACGYALHIAGSSLLKRRHFFRGQFNLHFFEFLCLWSIGSVGILQAFGPFCFRTTTEQWKKGNVVGCCT